MDQLHLSPPAQYREAVDTAQLRELILQSVLTAVGICIIYQEVQGW
jgi:hypothetical protein